MHQTNKQTKRKKNWVFFIKFSLRLSISFHLECVCVLPSTTLTSQKCYLQFCAYDFSSAAKQKRIIDFGFMYATFRQGMVSVCIWMRNILAPAHSVVFPFRRGASANETESSKKKEKNRIWRRNTTKQQQQNRTKYAPCQNGYVGTYICHYYYYRWLCFLRLAKKKTTTQRNAIMPREPFDPFSFFLPSLIYLVVSVSFTNEIFLKCSFLSFCSFFYIVAQQKQPNQFIRSYFFEVGTKREEKKKTIQFIAFLR